MIKIPIIDIILLMKKLINNDRYYLDFSSDNLWTDTKYLKSKISYHK